MNTEAQRATREQTVNQMGADVAVQVMLMMLFACMSQFADRADALQKQLRDQLLDITEKVTLPPGSEHLEQEVRRAAREVISNVFVGVSAIDFPREEA
jgi:hypothetical protein